MFIPAGSYQALMDLNAELWVLAKYRNAFAEKSGFWVIYSDPEKRERLGSAITKKDAWVKAYHNMKGVNDDHSV